MDNAIDRPPGNISPRQIMAHYHHKLGEEIDKLLHIQEDHVKTIEGLKDELGAFKEAWSSSDRNKRAMEEEFTQKQASWEAERRSLENQIASLKGSERRVICLIDGDGTIFSPDLVARGELGGIEAARMLTEFTREYLYSKHNLNHDQFNLWTYIFYNKRGLVEALGRADLGEKYKFFKEFIVGFNKASERFLMVDVGTGKELADTKIKAHLEDNIRLPQTAKILFGGCHDNGYVATLRSLITDGFRDKIILLPGYTDMAAGIQELGLPYIPTFQLFMPEKFGPGKYVHPHSSSDMIPAAPPGLTPLKVPTTPPGLTLRSSYSLALQTPAVPMENATGVLSESGDSMSGGSIDESPVGKKYRNINPNLSMSKQKPPPCTLFYLATCKLGTACRYGHDYILNEEHYIEISNNAKKGPCPAINNDEICTWGDNCVYGHKCPEGYHCRFKLAGRCKFIGWEMHSR